MLKHIQNKAVYLTMYWYLFTNPVDIMRTLLHARFGYYFLIRCLVAKLRKVYFPFLTKTRHASAFDSVLNTVSWSYRQCSTINLWSLSKSIVIKKSVLTVYSGNENPSGQCSRDSIGIYAKAAFRNYGNNYGTPIIYIILLCYHNRNNLRTCVSTSSYINYFKETRVIRNIN